MSCRPQLEYDNSTMNMLLLFVITMILTRPVLSELSIDTIGHAQGIGNCFVHSVSVSMVSH